MQGDRIFCQKPLYISGYNSDDFKIPNSIIIRSGQSGCPVKRLSYCEKKPKVYEKYPYFSIN